MCGSGEGVGAPTGSGRGVEEKEAQGWRILTNLKREEAG